MNCVYNGMAATIKPMAAINLEGERGRQWRALSVSDARMSRRNYLYSLPTQRLSAAAAAVAAELKNTALELMASGAWTGVEPVIPPAPPSPARERGAARFPRARSRPGIPSALR